MPRTKEEDNERKKKEYWESPDKYRLSKLRWRANNREKAMLYSARIRARQKGWAFDLTPEDIIIPTHCPVFGMMLSHATGKGVKDDSPSLDRIDCKEGYVKGNIRVVSWRANNLIRDGSLQEFEQIVRFLRGS